MTRRELLQMLVGDWRGVGAGWYPTITPFKYVDALRFTLDEARPLLHYEQRTRRIDPGQTGLTPSHWETGFVELLPDNKVEISNAQSGGRVEVLSGTVERTEDGLILRLQSSHFGNDPRMLESTRTMKLEVDILHYDMYMLTTDVDQLALHLEATLNRQT